MKDPPGRMQTANEVHDISTKCIRHNKFHDPSVRNQPFHTEHNPTSSPNHPKLQLYDDIQLSWQHKLIRHRQIALNTIFHPRSKFPNSHTNPLIKKHHQKIPIQSRLTKKTYFPTCHSPNPIFRPKHKSCETWIHPSKVAKVQPPSKLTSSHHTVPSHNYYHILHHQHTNISYKKTQHLL